MLLRHLLNQAVHYLPKPQRKRCRPGRVCTVL